MCFSFFPVAAYHSFRFFLRLFCVHLSFILHFLYTSLKRIVWLTAVADGVGKLAVKMIEMMFSFNNNKTLTRFYLFTNMQAQDMHREREREQCGMTEKTDKKQAKVHFQYRNTCDGEQKSFKWAQNQIILLVAIERIITSVLNKCLNRIPFWLKFSSFDRDGFSADRDGIEAVTTNSTTQLKKWKKKQWKYETLSHCPFYKKVNIFASFDFCLDVHVCAWCLCLAVETRVMFEYQKYTSQTSGALLTYCCCIIFETFNLNLITSNVYTSFRASLGGECVNACAP